MSAQHFSQRPFGALPSGETITCYRLKNGQGLELEFLDYGLTFISIHQYSNKLKRPVNTLLGADNLDFYLDQPFYMGSIIGRYCNRINPDNLILNNREVVLAQNAPPFHLHGGNEGLNKKVWEISAPTTDLDQTSVIATLISPNGDQGYPGKLDLRIRISLSSDNRIELEMNATSDMNTWVNLTHHAYFNLSGQAGEIRHDHMFKLNSSLITDIDASAKTTGGVIDIAQTGLDFTHARPLSSALFQSHKTLDTTGGLDHNYVFKQQNNDELILMAEAESLVSGVRLSVSSTQPGLQFYSAQHLNNQVATASMKLAPYYGFCFEPQHFPDSPNIPHFPSTLVTPEKPYKEKIVYWIDS